MMRLLRLELVKATQEPTSGAVWAPLDESMVVAMTPT